MPIALAATGWSRIAIRARPVRLCTKLVAHTYMTIATTTVRTYSHWSELSGKSKGASGLMMTMPCTPPVQCSTTLDFNAWGIAMASAKVASAR